MSTPMQPGTKLQPMTDQYGIHSCDVASTPELSHGMGVRLALTYSHILAILLHPLHHGVFLKKTDPLLRLCFGLDVHALWLDRPCTYSFFSSLVFQIFFSSLLWESLLLLWSQTSGSCGETMSTLCDYFFGSQSQSGIFTSGFKAVLTYLCSLVNQLHNLTKIGIKENFHAFCKQDLYPYE